MEHGEVQGKTKSDWVAGIQTLRGGGSELVILKGAILDSVKLATLGTLGNVSVVITDHLIEEGLGLISGGNFHAGALDGLDNGNALVVELLLNLFLVVGKTAVELGVLGVLLNCGDSSNGSSLGADLVLESDGKQVSLLSGEVLVFGLDNHLEVLDHVVKSLSLFSHSSHENIFFQTHW